jgi:regulator of chromosome condensation
VGEFQGESATQNHRCFQLLTLPQDNNGNFGFSVDRNWDTGKQSTDPDLNPETENVGAQLEPVLILDVTKKPLSGIVSVACGANHCLALDKDGNVWSWGTGQQMQLGHQIVERNRYAVLIPERCDLPKKKMKAVYTSEDHCFAVDKDENVWSWGLNNMGQCGITEGAGRDGNFVCPPKKVDALAGRKIVSFGLGRKHTVAVDEQGEVLAWGNVESGALGIDVSTVPEDAVLRGERQEIKVVAVPQVVPGIPAAAWVASGVDHNIAITKDGKAYSWGFGAEGQLGQGPGEDEVTPTVIANTAVKDKVLNWAGCGAGFSVVTAVAV